MKNDWFDGPESADAALALRAESRSRRRAGFTLMEVTVALAVLTVLAVIVAQCLAWSVRERARLASHQAALELAANTLETARAEPIERLSQAWADAQVIPSEMADLLPAGKIIVTVEPGQPIPLSRRVTVEVYWRFENDLAPHSVQLTAVLSERVTKKNGGKP
jgi:prepilin-type N-terminal cleavage/methylation domain-containing protein